MKICHKHRAGVKMSKKAIVTFLSQTSIVSKDESEISKFLNDKYTGEIYNVFVTPRNPNEFELYYTFFYEKLDEKEVVNIDI